MESRERSIGFAAIFTAGFAAVAVLGCSHPAPLSTTAAEPAPTQTAPAPAPDTPAPPAVADTQCASRLPDFTKSAPPVDFDGADPSDPTALAVFAWQHFVALNWPSSYFEATSHRTRGTPSTTQTFLGAPAEHINPVWLTYRNKNEMFPAGSELARVVPDADYNSIARYQYANGKDGPGHAVTPCTANDRNPSLFGNLDENSQLGLDFVFVDGKQVLFLAKINKDNYDYIVRNKLYDRDEQQRHANINRNNEYYGFCQQTNKECYQSDFGHLPFAIGYCLPCGGAPTAGGGGLPPSPATEGTIHVKAAFRPLTSAELHSGRYLTSPIVYYKKLPGDKVCYANSEQPWGLVGLHIIHKTSKFPTFFFSTFEHVDNIKSNVTVQNTVEGGPPDTVGKQLAYQRASHEGKSLPSTAVAAVNQCVQGEVKRANPSAVWQYYQLVGTQGTPVDFAQSSAALPDYYLANNVIESNDFFQTFRGIKGKYHDGKNPDGIMTGANVRNTSRRIKADVGGCQGCHGNSQFQLGFDMSFISAGFANKAEAINDFQTPSLRAQYLEVIPQAIAPR